MTEPGSASRRPGSERTEVADRAIDPPFGRTVLHHLGLGAGTGFFVAGLAMLWFFVVVLFSTDPNGLSLIFLIAPIAAICGALIGMVSAFALGSALWMFGKLHSARFVYPAFAALLTTGIMRAWSADLGTGHQLAVAIGCVTIALAVTSEWTTYTLGELSRSRR